METLLAELAREVGLDLAKKLLTILGDDALDALRYRAEQRADARRAGLPLPPLLTARERAVLLMGGAAISTVVIGPLGVLMGGLGYAAYVRGQRQAA